MFILKTLSLGGIIASISKKMEIIKKYKNLFFLALLGIIFLVVYSWLNISGVEKFSSPDETTNYYFTKLFAQKTQLRVAEPLNALAGNIIQPRNTEVSGDFIVPASFTGIMLFYGSIAKVAGLGAVPFLTPLFSVLAVIFFYLLIKEFFSQQVALTSALMMFFLPPFWYYASRGLFHNVLFIDLLIIGLYFLFKTLKRNQQTKKDWWLYLLSGLFIGLALITRTSEIIWVSIVVTAILAAFHANINLKKLILILIPVLLVFFPVLYYNNQLFGSYLSFGYSQAEFGTQSVSPGGAGTFIKIQQMLFPFGINLDRTGHYVYQYIFTVFPWFFILLIVTIIWNIKNYLVKFFKKYFPISAPELRILSVPQRIYAGLYVFVFLWLIIYYGAYQFDEFYNSSQAVMGSSYLRYWLPIYVFGLPLCVLAVYRIQDLVKNNFLRKFIVPFILLLIIGQNVWWVLLEPFYGLPQIRKYVSDGQSLASAVFKLTPPEGIIISGLADKLFFPERRVIVGPPSDQIEFRENIKSILARAPLYYYFDATDENSGELKKRLSDDIFKLKLVSSFPASNSSLYQVLLN